MNPLIKNLKEAREKATQGEWSVRQLGPLNHQSLEFKGLSASHLMQTYENNGPFIALAANTTMDVIAYVDKLEKALVKAREIVEEDLENNKEYGCDCGADDSPNIGFSEVICYQHQVLSALALSSSGGEK